ncbi:hypothetical protein F5Y18DRAFT_428566 [Xylariaceae sp. FL1019]|nr:hypothetical protein F5Y18DRAFT_428566 [Xylariaceae sp. FL1019]
MQFSFTTILAALAMAAITEAQVACVYPEQLPGGACTGEYPTQCLVQESPLSVIHTELLMMLQRVSGALWSYNAGIGLSKE